MATMASAKREYRKTHLEKADSTAEVFKSMRWLAQRYLKISPPITHKEQNITDQAGRAAMLRECLLALR